MMLRNWKSIKRYQKQMLDPEYLRHQLLKGEGWRLRNTILKLNQQLENSSRRKEHSILTNQGMGKNIGYYSVKTWEKNIGYSSIKVRKKHNWPGKWRNWQNNDSRTSRYYQYWILCNLLKQQSAPDVDLDISDRNPLENHNLMTSWTNKEMNWWP